MDGIAYNLPQELSDFNQRQDIFLLFGQVPKVRNKMRRDTFDFTPLDPKKTPDGQDGLPVKPQKNGKVSITS